MPHGWLLGPLAASWEALGYQNGAQSRLRQPSWTMLTLFFPIFDPWGALGSLLGRLGSLLEASWVSTGRSWEALGSILDAFGGCFGAILERL